MNFLVSVIIPVYNAQTYISKAVESVVDLIEVGEVILIEDGSIDSTFELCESLEKKHKKVKLYTHSNGQNRGVAASRNLGLLKATCDFIAFLDSDDWYLSNRFERTKELFENLDVDGVYEPIGTYFYQDKSYLFGKEINKMEGDQIITFLKESVKPEELFYSLLTQSNGNFSTDGITLKKTLIDKVGKFSEDLEIHEDTEFWIRCAYYGKLVAPSNPKPVAIRGVHGLNSNNKVSFKSKALFYDSLFKLFKNKKIGISEKILLYKKHIFFNPSREYYQGSIIRKYSELIKIFLKTIIS